MAKVRLKLITLSVYIAFLLLVILSAGCTEEAFYNGSYTSCENVSYTQDGSLTRKLDVLLVVDTSGSMYDDLMTIGDRFSYFLGALENEVSNLDYRIAVMLAHAEGPWSGRFYTKTAICGDAPVLSGDSNTDFESEVKNDLLCKLHNPVSSSVDSGGESGLGSLNTALSTNLALNKQEGFFRSDAGLAVIFAADENEICHVPPGYQEFETWEDDFRYTPGRCANHSPSLAFDRLTSLKGTQPFTVAAVVDNRPGTYHYGWGYLGTQATLGYPGIIDLAGPNGIVTSILGTASQIAFDLLRIGEKVAENLSVTTAFPVPDDTTYVDSVSVAGRDVPFHYAYDARSVLVSASDAGISGDAIHISACTNN